MIYNDNDNPWDKWVVGISGSVLGLSLFFGLDELFVVTSFMVWLILFVSVFFRGKFE